MNRIPAIAIALFGALSAGSAVAADATLHEVYRTVEAGHLKQAETMMDQVLRDHPNSAKAHYVEAELQAKEGNAGRARTELATAERLAPGLPFAKADAVGELRRQIEPAAPLHALAVPATVMPAAPANGMPWGMLIVGLALVAAILFFIRTMTRPRLLPASAAGYGASGGQLGYPQPIGPGGAGPVGTAAGLGSGILGGLATGAAVGAGMVAGEALMHRVFDGTSHTANAAPLDSIADTPITANTDYDMGGNDFGISDAGSWDDSSGGGTDDWN
jgi:uncharacterized protein